MKPPSISYHARLWHTAKEVLTQARNELPNIGGCKEFDTICAEKSLSRTILCSRDENSELWKFVGVSVYLSMI